ncbi:MAG: LTXXQ domain protein [Pseudomonas sp.]|nr:LTXXQ domain protein [Pseudomonas sp.]
MRKSLIALLFAASLPALAHAMPEGGPQHNGEQRQYAERGQHLFKELNLDQKQRMAVGKLMREQMQTRHSITQSFLDKLPAAEQKAMQEQLAAAKSKNEQAIRALLTPEQQKAYDQAQQKSAERRAEMAEFKAWKAQRAAKAE